MSKAISRNIFSDEEIVSKIYLVFKIASCDLKDRPRPTLADNKDLWHKIEKIEQSLIKKDEEIKAIFKILKELFVHEAKPRNPIGFRIPSKNK